MISRDTIAAITTAPGDAGVGIIRVSGDNVKSLINSLFSSDLKPRCATLKKFNNSQGQQLDEVILLFFSKPNSFTGEDVLEIQGHGGQVLLELMLKEILAQDIRQAQPGEFSERAFLNEKIDLIQAEAIADLIESKTEQAVIAANRSLQGKFSERINQIFLELTNFRVYIEAAIDFPEEEIDFLAEKQIISQYETINNLVKKTLKEATAGVILRDGVNVAIIGEPNVGKSSLLNCLSQQEKAIVTEIPGTTRDIISVTVQIQGIPFCLKDTAGIRESDDPIEKIGIGRAKQVAKQADCLLLVIDSSKFEGNQFFEKETSNKQILVFNKIDLLKQAELQALKEQYPNAVFISVTQEKGIDSLEKKLAKIVSEQQITETTFSARQRHIKALNTVKQLLDQSKALIKTKQGELIAEQLREAQQVLGEITGKFSTEDLLGKIFSSFCIGK